MTSAAQLVCILLLCSLVPTASADDDPYAPHAAFVTRLAPHAEVSVGWVPGDQPAERYRIYGANGTRGWELLADVEADSLDSTVSGVAVPGGFNSYSVTGVAATAESEFVIAMNVGPEPCIWIFPPATIYITCMPDIKWLPIHGPVSVARPSIPDAVLA